MSVYAIVRAGGRQEKVSVGDVLVVDKVPGDIGSTFELPALLLVDGGNVTADSEALGKVKVSAEILGPWKGPKIQILKYKNKSRYRVRGGHRQHSTQIKITGIK